MPFDGYEFGNQLIHELQLKNVTLEKTSIGDHYDPDHKKVRVLENRLKRKKLNIYSCNMP